MATLAVQEAMGMKVDREAVATLVLPQLWAMSMGPRECNLSFSERDFRAHHYFHSLDSISIQTLHGRHQEAR